MLTSSGLAERQQSMRGTVRVSYYGPYVFVRLFSGQEEWVDAGHLRRPFTNRDLHNFMYRICELVELRNLGADRWACKVNASDARELALYICAEGLRKREQEGWLYDWELVELPQESVHRGCLVYCAPNLPTDKETQVLQILSNLQDVHQVEPRWPFIIVQLADIFGGNLLSESVAQQYNITPGVAIDFIGKLLGIRPHERCTYRH